MSPAVQTAARGKYALHEYVKINTVLFCKYDTPDIVYKYNACMYSS